MELLRKDEALCVGEFGTGGSREPSHYSEDNSDGIGLWRAASSSRAGAREPARGRAETRAPRVVAARSGSARLEPCGGVSRVSARVL